MDKSSRNDFPLTKQLVWYCRVYRQLLEPRIDSLEDAPEDSAHRDKFGTQTLGCSRVPRCYTDVHSGHRQCCFQVQGEPGLLAVQLPFSLRS